MRNTGCVNRIAAESIKMDFNSLISDSLDPIDVEWYASVNLEMKMQQKYY